MTSRLIYIVACADISLVLKTELHYFVYVPHLVYPFIHQWTLGLLLPFALVVNAAMNDCTHICSSPCSQSFWYISSCEIDHTLILCLSF